ncbi:MAG: serine hydrolase [Acidobacteriaceae bacterium]
MDGATPSKRNWIIPVQRVRNNRLWALRSFICLLQNHASMIVASRQSGELKSVYITALISVIRRCFGSITKTFTGLLLTQMVQQAQVQLDEPVRELLPPGTVDKPTTGAEITLLDISDQHAAFPRMPDNFHPADVNNPYADYNAKDLYAYIGKHGVAHPADAPFVYSNVAVGLLGQALADRAGVPYPTLLHEQVTGPLKMTDTAIALTPAMRARFIQGYDGNGTAAHAWDLDALAGAGAIRSDAADMLTYLEAQLHPDHLPAGVLTHRDGKTLPAAIAQSHIIRAEVGDGMHIALNWFRIDQTILARVSSTI